MNVLKLIGSIFALTSVILLGAGVYTYNQTKKFLENSMMAQGVVVGLASQSSSRGPGQTHCPIIRFQTHQGETITARGSLCSSPPSYKKGEKVTVRYDPKDPPNISIDSFFELWFLPLILSGIGAVMGAVGVPMILVSLFSARKEKWLRENGKLITTQFQSVVKNTSESRSGQHPYQIVSQWLDSSSNKVYVFKSKNIHFNPEQYIGGKEIPVRTDPRNPHKYWMDLSFLPQDAD
jgi:hypothetical protein